MADKQSNDIEVMEQTTNWIKAVVIGCNFCPFAARAMNRKTIRYVVLADADLKSCLTTLSAEFQYLDENESIETTFIILPFQFEDFRAYLDMTEKAEQFLAKENYEGVYQLASFHPEYLFAGAPADDAANYTNRSPYPMLHVLREDSVTKALEGFPNPENIPDNNIDFTRQKGLHYMQMLRAACME